MNETFQEYVEMLLERVNQPGLFTERNGILVTEIRKGEACGELTVTPESMNPRKIVHGGCLCTLMDTVAGVAACTGGRSCVTLNSTMNYIRAVSDSKKVFCMAKAAKEGRTISVVDCELRDERGDLVATGTYTYYLKEPLTDFLEHSRAAQESAEA